MSSKKLLPYLRNRITSLFQSPPSPFSVDPNLLLSTQPLRVYKGPWFKTTCFARQATLLVGLSGSGLTFLYAYSSYLDASKSEDLPCSKSPSSTRTTTAPLAYRLWEACRHAWSEWTTEWMGVKEDEVWQDVRGSLGGSRWAVRSLLDVFTMTSLAVSVSLVVASCAFYATRPYVLYLDLVSASTTKGCSTRSSLKAWREMYQTYLYKRPLQAKVKSEEQLPTQIIIDSVVQLRNPDRLEYVRNQSLAFYRCTWYGAPWKYTCVPIRHLEKTVMEVGRGQRLFANLRDRTTGDFYYIDWDELRFEQPKLWYALQCCIPWRSVRLDRDLQRKSAMEERGVLEKSKGVAVRNEQC